MQATSINTGVGDSPTPGNLLDEFEEAFQNCLYPMISEDTHIGENFEDLKSLAEANAQRFFDVAHRLESAFLQKRFLLSVQKPELLVIEENNDLKSEIRRKEKLIKKHTDKLSEWQGVLNDLMNRVGSTNTQPIRSINPNQYPVQQNPSIQMINSNQQMGQINVPNMNPGSIPMNHSGMQPNMNQPMGLNPMNQQPMVGQVAGTPSVVSINQGYQGMPSIGSPQAHVGVSTGNPLNSGNITNIGGSTVSNLSGTNNSNNMATVGANGMQAVAGQMYSPTMGMMGGLQGPLAYLEKTTTNIGMPDLRR